MEAIPLFQHRGTCIYVNNTTKVVKIPIILVNVWRRVSAVLTAIFRPTCSGDQVQISRVRAIFVPDLYYKLA